MNVCVISTFSLWAWGVKWPSCPWSEFWGVTSRVSSSIYQCCGDYDDNIFFLLVLTSMFVMLKVSLGLGSCWTQNNDFILPSPTNARAMWRSQGDYYAVIFFSIHKYSLQNSNSINFFFNIGDLESMHLKGKNQLRGKLIGDLC